MKRDLLDNDEIQCGLNGATIHMEHISKILDNPEYHEKVSAENLQKMRDFKAAATDFGIGEQGYFHMSLEPGATTMQGMEELTRMMRSHMRGELTTTPYSDF